MRILLVEDDSRMADVIAKGLREHTYAVDVAQDGEIGLYQASINDYDVIVLDVLLPKRDGYEVCRELRTRGNTTPILMLTARAAIDDRITGFDAGADDYLTKPFSFRELLARIHALLRRDSQLRPDVLEIADLIVDSISHRVSRANHEVQLTAKEYALLEYLARRDPATLHATRQLGGVSEEERERQIDRSVTEKAITHHQPRIVRGFANDGERAALAFTQRAEARQILR
jgi:DNA-binding response OmpR family regulator